MDGQLLLALLKLPAILIGFTVHEYAHALVAVKLGDDTPKRQGRLTLNPISHIDPIGLLLFMFAGFGWARPVQTNPVYFEDRRKGTLFVSLAGPASNLVVAILLTLVYKFVGGVSGIWGMILYLGIYMNVVLAVFNLIPVPPLDGSKILFGLLPPRYYFKLVQYEKIIQLVLMLLIFTGILGRVLNPIINMIMKLLGI